MNYPDLPAKLLPFDVSNSPRAEHFRTFTQKVPCSFAMTVPVDFSGLMARKRRLGASFYALVVHRVFTVLNASTFGRMGWMERGRQPGLWSRVDPSFTHFDPKSETFSTRWTVWCADEGEFLDHWDEANRRADASSGYLPLGAPPANTAPISMIPWTAFTAFHVNLPDPLYLAPVVTIGRAVPDAAGILRAPVSLQLHHAAGDGWHASRFFCRPRKSLPRLTDTLRHGTKLPRRLSTGKDLKRNQPNQAITSGSKRGAAPITAPSKFRFSFHCRAF